MNIKKSRRGSKSIYSDHLISTVCQEVISGRLSYTEATCKYQIRGHSTVKGWVVNYQRQYGSNLALMSQNNASCGQGHQDKDYAELKAQVKQLQAALDLARLENLALNTMIDIADRELYTDIKKKSGAKQ